MTLRARWVLLRARWVTLISRWVTPTTGHAWKSFAAGSAAAMVSGAVTHPIDLVKVRLQLAASGCSPSMMGTAMAVVQKEGATALYKGLSASLLRQATFIGTKFGSYDLLKSSCASVRVHPPPAARPYLATRLTLYRPT